MTREVVLGIKVNPDCPRLAFVSDVLGKANRSHIFRSEEKGRSNRMSSLVDSSYSTIRPKRDLDNELPEERKLILREGIRGPIRFMSYGEDRFSLKA